MGIGIKAERWIASHVDWLAGRLVAIKFIGEEGRHMERQGSWQSDILVGFLAEEKQTKRLQLSRMETFETCS